MSAQNAGGDCWIPLMDYAIRNGVSLSTLRRHIKANKVEYKVENGRYLLRDDGTDAATNTASAPYGAAAPTQSAPVRLASSDSSRLAKLELDLQKAREEIAELKTLIAFYEEQIPQRLDA